jgi:hypothetical protein
MAESDRAVRFETMPLYKYHACPENDQDRKEWVRQILVEHQLFFPSRRCFNDPFDCVVPSFLEIPGTILERSVEEFVERKFPNAADAEKVRMMTKLISVNSLEGLRRDLQNDVDGAGILCFCRVRDDILMWAQYADKHRGLCFEFDGSANCLFFGDAQPVEYEDYTPIPLGENNNRQMTRIILTKSKHWSYEREYRIVRPAKAGTRLHYPVELLTGIIFGCMMPRDVRELVKQWAKEGDCRVAFFEARPKAAEFGLDTVRID